MTYLSMLKIQELLRFYGATRYRDDATSRHRMVMSLFPKELGENPRSANRILYRFDRDSQAARCIIRSAIAPANLNGLKTIEEKLPENLNHVAFRVTANPITRNGKIERPIKEQYAQEEWVENKLSPALSGIEIINQKTEVLKRDYRNKKISLQLVQFDGIAKVENPDLLGQLLAVGVGRNKSYGAGLLTIKPLK